MKGLTRKTLLFIAMIGVFLGCSALHQPRVVAAVVPPNYQLMTSPTEDDVDNGGGTTSGNASPLVLVLVVVGVLACCAVYFWSDVFELLETKTMVVIRWSVGSMMIICSLALIVILMLGSR
jgi:hypothetical protein